MGTSNFFRSTAEFLITCLVFLFLLIIFPPIFICLLTPIYIYRFFLSYLVPKYRPELKRILPFRSAFMKNDAFTKSPYTIVSAGIVQGNFNIEEVRSLMSERLIDYISPKTGKLAFPELRQYLVKYMGYYFWKDDEDFCIKKHCFEYEGKGDRFNEKDFKRINQELVLKEFYPKQSPWDLIILNNFYPKGTEEQPQSIYFWRTHHCLGDGFTSAKLLLKISGETKDIISGLKPPTSSSLKENNNEEPTFSEKKKKKKKKKNDGIWKQFFFWTKFLFYSEFETIQTLVKSFDFNALHPSPFTKMSRVPVKAMSHPISLDKIKRVGKERNVGLTTVIGAVITGGIRSYMKNSGVKVPDRIYAGIPFPFPGHPDDKMINYYAIASVHLPIGEPNRMKRVDLIQKDLLQIRRSMIPLNNFLVAIPLLGAMLPSISKHFLRNDITTMILSSFPGPKRPISLFNKDLNHMYLDTSFYPGNYPLNITTITYNGNIHLILTGDRTIFKSESEMEKMLEFMTEEIDLLFSNALYDFV